MRQNFLKQADIFLKFKSAFEKKAVKDKTESEVMVQFCQAMHDICILLAEREVSK